MHSLFEGIKVLDFTNNAAGPNAAALLGDFGAEVIKVERPVAGDDSRGVQPRMEGQSILYHWFNRSKKSVTLALDDPRSTAVLKRMLADMDIVIESFPPGVMKKFNLDYDSVVKINPGVVYCSISVCGQTGKYKTKPGFDLIAQGMSGLMDLTGEPDGAPVKSGFVIGDSVGTLNAFAGIAAAMYHKLRTGEGQHIDIALLDGLLSANNLLEGAANMATHPTRSGSHSKVIFPYGIYQSKNKQSAVIAAFTAGTFSRLCIAMGKPEFSEDPRFSSNISRGENFVEFKRIIEEWLSSFEEIADAIEVMEANGVPACKIYSTDDTLADPVYWERGLFTHQEMPPSFKEHRTMISRGPWIRLSKTPATPFRSADLGEHNSEVLTHYGMSQEEIDQCVRDWENKFKKQ